MKKGVKNKDKLPQFASCMLVINMLPHINDPKQPFLGAIKVKIFNISEIWGPCLRPPETLYEPILRLSLDVEEKAAN